MAQEAKQPEGSDQAKKARHRSPNYPTVGLRSAIERVRKLYENDGKAGAPPELAAKHIGFSSAHGEAHSVLAALKKFGLVDAVKDRLAPTQRAVEIINLPEDDSRRAQALREAALSPTIYKELCDQHLETGFPKDDVLERELVTYRNFNPNAVAGFVRDFKDTLEFAGLSELGALKSESMRTQQEQPETTFPATATERSLRPPILGGQARPTKAYAWALSPEATAQLVINGDVSKDDLETLRDYIEITIKALSRSTSKPE